MAHLKKEITGYTGGLEGGLTNSARFLVFLAIATLAAFLTIGANTNSIVLIGAGISSLIVFIAWSLLLRMGAEIIRLLKKMNNLPYGGKISVAQETCISTCSNCGKRVANYLRQCNGCKELFEKPKSDNDRNQ